jgi:Protein of unknown function (DUF1488)
MTEVQRLVAIAYPANVTIRGIRFAMLDLGDLVDILVTHAALDRMEVSTGDDYLARFDKHRASFERVANDKYARGEIEDDGSIALLPGDF